jgi:hypothetical protein
MVVTVEGTECRRMKRRTGTEHGLVISAEIYVGLQDKDMERLILI